MDSVITSQLTTGLFTVFFVYQAFVIIEITLTLADQDDQVLKRDDNKYILSFHTTLTRTAPIGIKGRILA